MIFDKRILCNEKPHLFEPKIPKTKINFSKSKKVKETKLEKVDVITSGELPIFIFLDTCWYSINEYEKVHGFSERYRLEKFLKEIGETKKY